MADEQLKKKQYFLFIFYKTMSIPIGEIISIIRNVIFHTRQTAHCNVIFLINLS